MSAQLERWHFNVDQYYRLAEVGVLQPDDRVELIEGEIIKMRPIGSPHAACVKRASYVLRDALGDRAIVSVQDPVRLNEFSEPIPDIALLRPRKDFYADHHPTPAEVLLIIEVSDTTILSDRNVKVPLYARAGIPETWLVNLNKNQIEVYYHLSEGRYEEFAKFKAGDTIISPTVAALSLKVDELIG